MRNGMIAEPFPLGPMEPQIYQIPPLELVQQWLGEQYGRATVPGQVTIYITTQAAQWGYQQATEELETFLRKSNDAH